MVYERFVQLLKEGHFLALEQAREIFREVLREETEGFIASFFGRAEFYPKPVLSPEPPEEGCDDPFGCIVDDVLYLVYEDEIGNLRLATSTDFVNFTKKGIILSPTPPEPSVGMGCLLYEDGLWKLYYATDIAGVGRTRLAIAPEVIGPYEKIGDVLVAGPSGELDDRTANIRQTLRRVDRDDYRGYYLGVSAGNEWIGIGSFMGTSDRNFTKRGFFIASEYSWLGHEDLGSAVKVGDIWLVLINNKNKQPFFSSYWRGFTNSIFIYATKELGSPLTPLGYLPIPPTGYSTDVPGAAGMVSPHFGVWKDGILYIYFTLNRVRGTEGVEKPSDIWLLKVICPELKDIPKVRLELPAMRVREFWRNKTIGTVGETVDNIIDGYLPCPGYRTGSLHLISNQDGTVEVHFDMTGLGDWKTLPIDPVDAAVTANELWSYFLSYLPVRLRIRFTPVAEATVSAWGILRK